MDPIFHWFGGKRRAASLVWERLGSVQRYIEPFTGSAAVLLARSRPQGREVINDIDGFLVNFWRAVRDDAQGVAKELEMPISELDLIARKKRFTAAHAESLVAKLQEDPDYYDRTLAAWWYFGHCASVGNRWLRKHEIPTKFLPAMDSRGIADRAEDLVAIQRRLVDVFILCGDWRRTVDSDTVLFNGAKTVGIFFDPPYASPREKHIYSEDDESVAIDVETWCLEHGEDPRLRIVIAGYEGEHDALESAGWLTRPWIAQGGHGNRRQSGDNANRFRETLWCSPHCIGARQSSLFEDLHEYSRVEEIAL